MQKRRWQAIFLFDSHRQKYFAHKIGFKVFILNLMKKLVHDKTKCLKCAGCVGVCSKMALDMYGLDLQIDYEKCVRCGLCTNTCPVGALKIMEVDNA